VVKELRRVLLEVACAAAAAPRRRAAAPYCYALWQVLVSSMLIMKSPVTSQPAMQPTMCYVFHVMQPPCVPRVVTDCP
jgi:hypothetical protein